MKKALFLTYAYFLGFFSNSIARAGTSLCGSRLLSIDASETNCAGDGAGTCIGRLQNSSDVLGIARLNEILENANLKIALRQDSASSED